MEKRKREKMKTDLIQDPFDNIKKLYQLNMKGVMRSHETQWNKSPSSRIGPQSVILSSNPSAQRSDNHRESHSLKGGGSQHTNNYSYQGHS